MACKAPQDFELTAPNSFPHDLPFAIAFTSDEFDPWTETSHKFRLYNQPVLTRSDPMEVDVGTISEVLVFADENSQFFDAVPVN